MSFFNQLKNKAEELNKKHNIVPSFGQNHQPQQQGHAPSPYHQNYPGQPQPQPQYPGYNQPAPPPPGSWQQQQQSPSQLAAYGNYYAEAPPPPIPYHSRPGGSSGAGGSSFGNPSVGNADPTAPAPRVYWRPDFSPATPVSQAFEHKQGHGEPYGWGNNELQVYTASPANSFHTVTTSTSTNPTTGQQQPHPILVVRAIAQPQHPDPEARFTSARLVSRTSLGSDSGGALSATLTLPCAPGVWPAFWLLPREPFRWPRDGEVDVAETWDGDGVNRACLHWGYYDGAPGEPEKHRVRETRVPDLGSRPGGVRFDFVWYTGGNGNGNGNGGANGTRLMWYVDGRPVMRNWMPEGARPIGDFCVLLNVAMGGNVCQGKVPREGVYDLVVHDLHMSEAPEGGWGRFEADWQRCPDGAVM
ncbi:hypothetical protein SLS62_000371 [Diatrype stigma]|uniref:GH16 domain-containing protein n=1 Tax=Diatrype stigma TaxID=117547 RepID=A0AAN9UXE7_9PEZI